MKHCIRPHDMTGKSAALILRKINPYAMQQAKLLQFEEVLQRLQMLDINRVMPLTDDISDQSHKFLLGGNGRGGRNAGDEGGAEKIVKCLLNDIVTRIEREEDKVERSVRKVLDRMINRLERKDFVSDDKREVKRVMQMMISSVERSETQLFRSKKRSAQEHQIVRSLVDNSGMTARLKKNRKKRGHVSAGHGRIGKHRKHPGGRGNAGGQHHHRLLFDRFHPGYFGKVGMRHYHLKRNMYHCPTVNVEKLWSLVDEATRVAAEEGKESGKAPVIDLTKAGYFKLLGKGRLPEIPVIVKAKFFSKTAEQKVKEAGGACILTA
eukprot:TRINITY_DN38725_c0_g1_i1.p1 TRINITY_DN38725_c0_g1~~TRINITY_DN38725_c0_g1_i1.p1  ORF type:complete len:322 (+),score=39.14 TRINITY_DN38725_c0_g1_i1:5-970(+)